MRRFRGNAGLPTTLAACGGVTSVRAFLALGLLYVVTSSFTLAKCIRDRQEEAAIVSRVDQARLDKLLAEQDLLRVENQ